MVEWSRCNTADKKSHAIGGTGGMADGEVPLHNHDSFNDLVHLEIRVVTLSVPPVCCTSESVLKVEHVDATELVSHNIMSVGTVSDGKSPPHANLSEANLHVRYKDSCSCYAKLAC